jgi:hypothetical protein
MQVWLSVLDTFKPHISGHDRSFSKHPDGEQTRYDLFLLFGRQREAGFDARQVVSLGLHRSIAIHEKDTIVEDRVDAGGVFRLDSVIPGSLQSDDFCSDGALRLGLGGNLPAEFAKCCYQEDEDYASPQPVLGKAPVSG